MKQKSVELTLSNIGQLYHVLNEIENDAFKTINEQRLRIDGSGISAYFYCITKLQNSMFNKNDTLLSLMPRKRKLYHSDMMPPMSRICPKSNDNRNFEDITEVELNSLYPTILMYLWKSEVLTFDKFEHFGEIYEFLLNSIQELKRQSDQNANYSPFRKAKILLNFAFASLSYIAIVNDVAQCPIKYFYKTLDWNKTFTVENGMIYSNIDEFAVKTNSYAHQKLMEFAEMLNLKYETTNHKFYYNSTMSERFAKRRQL